MARDVQLAFFLPSRAAWNISHSDLLGNRPLHNLWIRRLAPGLVVFARGV